MAPVLSGDFVAFGATPKRHLHSPQSTLEFRSVTAVEDRREMGALHSPIREDCGLGRDDCDAWCEDSTCTLPFTPERGAPPSYEHVMTSPMPVGPPRSPPRRGHQNSYSGEGTQKPTFRLVLHRLPMTSDASTSRLKAHFARY